ncbi:hypothetical protein ACQ4PT_040555 [Festuca glaucescens]
MARSKRAKNTSAGAAGAGPVEKKKVSGWDRSKFNSMEHRKLKKLGLLTDEGKMKIPGDEMTPNPPEGYRVIFSDFLLRGLSVPVHEFLRGLLFIYGIQLYQLTPNSILHISIFITLCECFLGIHPHWGLWKRIFYLRRNNLRDAIYDVRDVCICVRPEARYFDLKFADSVQGWRKKWLYVKDKTTGNQQYGLTPFDMSQEILRCQSWDAEATPEEVAATEHLIERIKTLQTTRGKELSGVQIIAHFLRIQVQPIQARSGHLWLYCGAGDIARISEDLPVQDLEKLVRRFTSLSLNIFCSFVRDDEMHSEHDASGPAITSASQTLIVSEDPKLPPETTHPPKSPRALKKKPRTGTAGKGIVTAGNSSTPHLDDPITKEMLDMATHFIGFRDEADTLRRALRVAQEHAKELEKKLEASEKARRDAEAKAAKRIGEMYTRNQEQEEDELLDSLTTLEMNCTLARDCLKEARAAFERLFPHFFPKDAVPDKFEPLAKCFTGKDDPVLTHC